MLLPSKDWVLKIDPQRKQIHYLEDGNQSFQLYELDELVCKNYHIRIYSIRIGRLRVESLHFKSALLSNSMDLFNYIMDVVAPVSSKHSQSRCGTAKAQGSVDFKQQTLEGCLTSYLPLLKLI